MKKFAVTLDIGTTNIDALLIDLKDRRIVLSLSRPNEQLLCGDDVISRLKVAGTKEGTKELHKRVIASVTSIISDLAARSCIEKEAITTILAVGNAAMYHLTLLLPVDKLARAPFLPHKKELVRKAAGEVGLEEFSGAEFIFLPNIGGFVGSDAIGVIFAMDMHKRRHLRLAIDLGTNGEVILGNREKILVTSTAAGPAFEGWHINCGSPPRPGAIISFEMKEDKPAFTTIEGASPTGIASSGLVEIVASLIDKGIIDKTGRLRKRRFTIYADGDKEIFLDQKDIRQVQLAKSAIQTAVNILMENYGVDYEDIEEVVITGRFGGSLTKEGLMKMGMISPHLREKRFGFVEALSLRGAALFLMDDRTEELKKVLEITRHVELHKEKSFQDAFAQGLHF